MSDPDREWPTTDSDLSYDMFEVDLDVATRHAETMRARLREAEQAIYWPDKQGPVLAALDEAWRVESALGSFLAMDDVKAELAGYRRAKDDARRGFEAVRRPLRDGQARAGRPVRELDDYILELADAADAARSAIEDARDAIDEPAYERIASVAERSTVAIARTADDPDAGGIEALVREAVDRLGGMERFVAAGDTVLIKPNLTVFLLAHEGVTTDPRVVTALVRLAWEAGAGEVLVGESSGGGDRTRTTMKVTGMIDAAEEVGARVVPFDEVEQREVEIPGARFAPRIRLPAPLLDADVVINAPKLKVHHMDPISGAIKNWVGCVRADIREHYHDWHTYQQYAEIMTVTKPALTVMDGIHLGEGNGPVACEGRFWGGIIASADPVALDVVAAQILGFDPRHVTFATVAATYGLGQIDPDRIDVVGEPLERARIAIKAPRIGMGYIDANIIVGLGVSHSGTLGHFKSIADLFDANRVWSLLIDRLRGRPTVLIGDAEDPLFERHVEEGPYVVIDDAAPARYREDSRVTVIPGHPVLHNMIPLLLDGLEIAKLGAAGQKVMKTYRGLRSRIRKG